MPKLSSESALQRQLTRSLSPSRLMAGEVPYSPTEPICIIFKEIDSISIVMEREPAFARKLAKNKAKTTNPMTPTTALAMTLPGVLLLSLPALGLVDVWAANFVGTSGPDRIVGTDEDDKIFGKKGNDNLRGEGGDDYIAGNAGNDEIHDGPGRDKVWGGSGDDRIGLSGVDEQGFKGGDTAWGGSGDDKIGQSSECPNNRAFGGAGNDRITTVPFVKGGPGNDIIEFRDCGGVAYGGSGNDEIRGGDENVKLHGGSGDDILFAGDFGNDYQLFGDKGDDTLTGSFGADYFNCGPGTDTIVDFDAAKDTKTGDCENVLEESIPVLDNNDNNDNNDNTTETATTTSSTPSSGVAEDSPATEEEDDASSLPGTTTTTMTSSSSRSDDAIETRGVTETVEAQTMEVLSDEKP